MASKKITRKTKFTQVMKNKKAVEVLMSHGIYCMGCPMAGTENLEQGLEAHGLDVDEVLDKINGKKKKKS